jgi:hypothetical protein
VAIACDHPRPKLDLPGYIPRRMAWQVPQNIPGLPPEAARVIRQALQGVYDELSRQGQVRNVIPLVEDLFVRPGSVVVGIADGQTVTLLPPGATGYTDPVTIILTDVSDPVTVVRPDGTQDILGEPGAYEYEPAGSDQYETSPGSAILAGGVPTDRLLGRDSPGTGAVEFIGVGPGLKFDGAGTLDVRFGGAPIYDVLAPPYNAVGNGVADDTTAIQAAITAAAATGGIVYLGRAHLITSTLVVFGDGIWVRGRGIHPNNGTKIRFNGAGASCKAVQILGFQHSGISDCYIEAAKVYTADALLEFDGVFRGFGVNLSLTNGYNAIHVYRSTETWISWFQIRNPFGPRGVLFDGTAAVHSYRCILETAGMDCPYPFAIVGLGAAWTAAQAVVVGNIRHNTDGIWSCSTAGTTSGAGTGPAKSSIATTNPTTYRTTTVTDGTAAWRWVCDRNLTWVTLDSYASTLTVSKLALISGAIGVRHSNTIGGSGARGDGIIATDLEIDHAYDFGIFLEEGYDAQFHGGTVTSCQFDAGVRIGAGYGVDWTIEGMRIFGNAKAGISVAHGSGKIQNNRIGHNGTLTANTYDGISVDDGVTRFVITGNFVGELGYTGNAQRTGIQLNGTLSDDYCVTGNDCSGNLTAAIFNGPGVATTRVVRNNVPDTTTGIIPDADYGDITVTISGTTWTIDNGVVTNAKLANMAGARVKGRTLNAGTGAPTDMTGAEVGQIVRYGTDVEDTSTGTVASFVIANTTTSVRCTPATALTIQGIAYTGPADPEAGKEVILYNSRTSAQNITLAHNSGSAGAAQYRLFLPGNVDMVLRPGDGVRLRYAFSRWIGGSPASVSDADYGDITVTAGGGTWTIDAGVVTLAKQANLAQSTIQGRAEGAGTGVPQALTPTQVVAIIDGESPTWSASHRFDSFIQFGTSTALPASGDIRKAGTLLISTADDLNLTALDNSTITISNTLAMSGGAAVTITSSNTMALTATATLTLTAGTSVSVPSFLGVSGAAEFSSSLTARASVRWSTVATATLAARQDNFTAGACAVSSFTLTGNQTLTGIVPNSTSEGCLMLVVNADTVDNLTLAHDQTSTAANRFLLPGSTDRVLLPNAMALLWYDFNASRWRMVYGT